MSSSEDSHEGTRDGDLTVADARKGSGEPGLTERQAEALGG
jgi:hypothetical protein